MSHAVTTPTAPATFGEHLHTFRQIVAEHQHQEIAGLIVDATTAHVALAVYDAVNPTNKAHMEAMTIERAAALAYKLTAR